MHNPWDGIFWTGRIIPISYCPDPGWPLYAHHGAVNRNAHSAHSRNTGTGAGGAVHLKMLNKTYGVDVILFTDDYPSPDRARWEGILDLLIKKDMGIKILMETRAKDIIRDADILDKYKKAGIIHIYVGTEATEQECLDYIKKDLSIEESKEALRLLEKAKESRG